MCFFSRLPWFIRFPLLGLLAVVLIGPALSVAGTLLPFAIIGGLVWIGVRVLRRVVRRIRGDVDVRRPGWREVLPVAGQRAREAVLWGMDRAQEAAPAIRARAEEAGRGAARVVRRGLGCCQEVAPVVGEHARRAWVGGVSRARVLGRLFVEMVCGGIVGGVAGWFTVGEPEYVFAGALAGVVLGLMAGVPKRQPAAQA
jgi:hypothetical protein